LTLHDLPVAVLWRLRHRAWGRRCRLSALQRATGRVPSARWTGTSA